MGAIQLARNHAHLVHRLFGLSIWYSCFLQTFFSQFGGHPYRFGFFGAVHCDFFYPEKKGNHGNFCQKTHRKSYGSQPFSQNGNRHSIAYFCGIVHHQASIDFGRFWNRPFWHLVYDCVIVFYRLDFRAFEPN